MQKKYLLLFTCVLLSAVVVGQHQQHTSATTEQQNADTARIQKEEDFYKITTIPIPRHVELEVGGMVFLPGDKLAVCTRRGEVWIITNPYMRNGESPQYRLFARGLHEALGLNLVGDDLYVVHRAEITRLRDLDADGEADEYKTVYTWPLVPNYHEYAYGTILDKQGNMVLNLNLGWTNRAISLSKWDGWMLKVDTAGNMKPFATGLRSPAGMGINGEGDIFYSENQGDWVGSGYVAHVSEGDFMGNPEGLKWAGEPGSPVKLRFDDIPDTDEPKYDVAKRVPGLKPPAVWLPHTLLGISTSDLLLSDNKGKMGPFDGQFFVGDQGHSKIMRVALEKVKGVYQGAAFPFRDGFSSGVFRMKWGSDGSMFVGMTNRGWGSWGPEPFGLQRLEWNGKTPFVMKAIKAMPDGFEIEFTTPVDIIRAKAANYTVTSFTYKYGHKYGSPVINDAEREIKAMNISPDGKSIRLVLDSIKPGYIHEIKLEGVRSNDNFLLMHNVGYYTLNQIPDGEKLVITEENRMKPKPKEEEPVAEKALTIKAGTTTKAPVQAKRLLKQPTEWSKPDQSIILKPVNGLKYDNTNITVKAGAKVKLTFENTDDMPHNVVITAPGSADEVGVAALNMGLSGERMHYVPQSSKVLFYTGLLQPGKTETIYFTAPSAPGNYPFVCTYPGHYLVMRGIIKVAADK
ncbi:MAG: hypothetical protein KIT80_07680 [Chitinophagaceae bacterium]|nr:hypothetical protein [Chitinophagaceae bacterium]MCW5926773.1 hypothetical protein [Chitinophagaceae bacterium]